MAIFSKQRRLVLTVAAAVFLISSCEESTEDSNVTVIDGPQLSGEKLYQQNCTSCHGKKGDLGVSGATDLTKSTKTLQEKVDFINKGSDNGVMQSFGEDFGGHLNQDEVTAIATYIDTM